VKALEKIARKVSGRPKLTLDDQKDLLVLFRWLLYPIFKVTSRLVSKPFCEGEAFLALTERLCGCFPDGSGLGPQPGDFVAGQSSRRRVDQFFLDPSFSPAFDTRALRLNRACASRLAASTVVFLATRY